MKYIFAAFCCIVSFSFPEESNIEKLREYFSHPHDKLFFGVGGGIFQGINEHYTAQFSTLYSPALVLNAGVGDYPFVFDIKYCVQWAEGFSGAYRSGAGASLTEYEIMSGMRIYLFWRNRRVKNYLLFSGMGSQEVLRSSSDGGVEPVQTTEGVRFGFAAGLCFDIFPADYCFLSLDFVYKYLHSDFFKRKELVVVELIFNIGT